MNDYDLPIALPGFMQGFASAVDTGGALLGFDSAEEADGKAIGSDWAMVGKDIITAVAGFVEE